MVDVDKNIVKHYFFKFMMNFFVDDTCDALIRIYFDRISQISTSPLFSFEVKNSREQ